MDMFDLIASLGGGGAPRPPAQPGFDTGLPQPPQQPQQPPQQNMLNSPFDQIMSAVHGQQQQQKQGGGSIFTKLLSMFGG